MKIHIDTSVLVFFRILLIVFSATSLTFATSVWDETVDGPLSSDPLAPTQIMLLPGSNTIEGTVMNSPLEPDFVTFTVDSIHALESITLTKYETGQSLSFIALQSGNQITSTFSAVELLGSALIGTGNGSSVGDNILDDLGEAATGGAGFEGGLPAGTYTLWFQETADNVNYGLNMHVIPEPSGLALAGMLSLVCLTRRRRRS